MFVPESLLRAHVKESNAIERIYFRAGPYVQSHLAAAIEARSATVPHPSILHRILSLGTELERHGGMYRRARIFVGNGRSSRECPKPRFVPELMAWWQEIVRQYLARKNLSPLECDKVAFMLHHYFLCIHPFDDGNGRTARLVLNSLRLAKGLPWLVIKESQKQAYYARIREFEADTFRGDFPDVY